MGLPGGSSGQEPAYWCRSHERRGIDPWVGKTPWGRKWQPTPVFLLGKSQVFLLGKWTEKPGRLQSKKSSSRTQLSTHARHTRLNQYVLHEQTVPSVLVTSSLASGISPPGLRLVSPSLPSSLVSMPGECTLKIGLLWMAPVSHPPGVGPAKTLLFPSSGLETWYQSTCWKHFILREWTNKQKLYHFPWISQ